MDAQIVKLVLVALISLSVVTWSIMIWKGLVFWKKRKLDRDFSNRFWQSTSIDAAKLLSKSAEGDFATLANLGFDVLEAKNHQNLVAHYGSDREILDRQLRAQLQRFSRRNEKGLTELATIGSASPFVGLFGTVWGIKTALQDIGLSGQAGLDVVAGPIGEALIATAAGIAVALPAVLAYNFFLRRIAVFQTEIEVFCEDFVMLICGNSK